MKVLVGGLIHPWMLKKLVKDSLGDCFWFHPVGLRGVPTRTERCEQTLSHLYPGLKLVDLDLAHSRGHCLFTFLILRPIFLFFFLVCFPQPPPVVLRFPIRLWPQKPLWNKASIAWPSYRSA